MATQVLKDWEIKKICWENEVYVIQTPISSKVEERRSTSNLNNRLPKDIQERKGNL